MQLNEKIEECYKSGTQLWIVSDDPLSIPKDYGLYRKHYGSMNIVPRCNVHRTIFHFTLPVWLIMPGSMMVDYSAIPKERRIEIPGMSYKEGKESIKFGMPDSVLDILAHISKESKERTAAVPKNLLAEIQVIDEAGYLPDPDVWVEKTHKLWDTPSGPSERGGKVFFI